MSHCLSSPLPQILMSVWTALSSAIVNPLVSTCPAGTTVSAVTATMTTACFPPMGNHVWVSCTPSTKFQKLGKKEQEF